MKKILLLSFCALAMFSASAQDNGDIMKRWQDYSTPGDMQALLAKSEGNWDVAVSMWMGPGDPIKNNATSESKMILGGRYEQITNKGSFNGMTYEGVGIIGYDNAKKLFQSSWMDNMGTGVVAMEGTYDAATKKLTLNGKSYDPTSGRDIEMRQTFTFVDDTHQVIEMFQVAPDGKENRMMEMKLTKK